MKTSSKMRQQNPQPKPLILIIIFIFFASCIVIAGFLVYAPLRERLWIIVFFGISLLIASAVGTVLIWQWQGTRFYRERYETTEALRKSFQREQFLANIIRDVSIGVAVGYPDGRLGINNTAFQKLTGYSEEELQTINWNSVLTPIEWRESEAEKLTELLSTKMPVRYEKEYIRKDGSRIPIELLVHPYFDDKGNVEYYIGFFTDITERKQTEEKLKEREFRYSELVNNINSGVAVYKAVDDGADFVFLDFNAYGEKIENINKDLVINRKVTEVFPGVIEFGLLDVLRRVWKTGSSESFPLTLYKDNRISGWKQNYVYKLPSGEIVAIYDDLTEQKRIEESLRESEAQFRLLVENAPDAIFVQTQHRFAYMNSKALKLFGAESFAQLIGQPVLDRFHHSFHDIVNERIRLLNEEKKIIPSIEQIYLKVDNTPFDVEVSAVPIHWEGHDGALVFFRDITERKKLEEQLLQSQKMESIGTLAGGVAHDFNNILTTIIGYGNLALMKMATDDPFRMHIEHMLESADRAAHLTQSLLAFSRKQLVDKQPVDLNTVLKKAGEFLKRVIGEHIECKINLYKEPIHVLADSNQLQQVILNLATNARDAMPKGGLFKISAEQVMLDDEFITLHGFNRRGQYALITVEDTGAGMDEDTKQRIFEPFFTTKEVGKGTGLGLSVVYGIVKQHDGYINVYSEPGKGTAFKIYLPIIESKAKKGRKTYKLKTPEEGTEAILMAEDDENLRKLNLMMFEEFGYTVIEAVDGEDAVRKFKENKDIIQLLLFDLIMPKKSGKDAYDEIAKIKPDIKAIFISGYSSDMIGDTASLGDNVSFIQKPVTPTILLKKVRKVLDEETE